MIFDLTRSNEKLSDKIAKSKKQVNEDLINIMVASFKSKEDEMANDIRKFWESKYEEFMNTSEYYAPSAFLSKQLKVSSMSKEFYKSCWYTFAQLGVYKFGGKGMESFACVPTNKEDQEGRNKLKLDRYLDLIITESILNSRYKLLQSVIKHFDGVEIDEVEVVSIDVSKGNLVGTFKIRRAFGLERTLTTQAVYAGGYNIQKFHIRYLSKVV